MGLNESFGEITRLTNKKELVEFIEKRFTTSFIGGLSSVEEHLYDLFTDEEWSKYWPPLREEILNKANAQKRLAIKELDKYVFTKITPQDKNTKEFLQRREDERYNR